MTGRTLVVGLCLGLCMVGPARASEFGASGEVSSEGLRSSAAGGDYADQSAGGSGDLLGYKVASQGSDDYKKQDSGSYGNKYPPIQESPNKGELQPMFALSEWTKLIFSPLDLVKKISDTFRLPMDKFVDKIGKGAVFGAEAMITPMIASFKIIEKVFVPDQCRMKLLCQIGSRFGFVKDTVQKFSPKLFEGSSHTKAITDGVIGQNCDVLFKDCEPKLKKPYEELKGSR